MMVLLDLGMKRTPFFYLVPRCKTALASCYERDFTIDAVGEQARGLIGLYPVSSLWNVACGYFTHSSVGSEYGYRTVWSTTGATAGFL